MSEPPSEHNHIEESGTDEDTDGLPTGEADEVIGDNPPPDNSEDPGGDGDGTS